MHSLLSDEDQIKWEPFEEDRKKNYECDQHLIAPISKIKRLYHLLSASNEVPQYHNLNWALRKPICAYNLTIPKLNTNTNETQYPNFKQLSTTIAQHCIRAYKLN